MPRTTRTTTAATPQPDPRLRMQVLEALALLPNGRRATNEMLIRMVNELRPVPAADADIVRARDWNHDRQFVNFERNEVLEREEWFITSMGRTALVQH